jgi:stage V sporulation protein D (sporulation-specific penicillin-binding protein)
VAFLAVGVSMLLVAARLLWVQVLQGGALAREAAAIHLRTEPLPAQRGEIVDRSGRVLALSVPGYSLYADPQEVRDPGAATARLAPLLTLPADLVRRRLSQPGRFVWIDREISADQAQAIRALHLPGLYLAPTSLRRYPQGMLLGHVLGFAGLDGNGLAGLELAYNAELAGRAGYAVERFDALGNPLPDTLVRQLPPTPGRTLQLEVDSGIQFALQSDLEAELALTRARQGWGIVMDPSNGAVLAMAAWPTFDPNHFASAAPAIWRNPVVEDTFVPGSVFKPVTAATALDAGVVAPHTPFSDPGVLDVDGVALHDFQRLDRATDLTRALEESANVVFGQVGLLVGRTRFYQGLRAFGFFGPTGVDLPGESRTPNLFMPESRATALTLAEMSFGESVAVTPLSLMTALNAIANGGQLLAPRVAHALLGPDGRVERVFPPRVLGRPIPTRVADEVRAMMLGVVRYGTGQRGFIPCYDVAGKTGTANIDQNGRTLPNAYYASFYAFAPAERPRVAVLVTVVDPQGAMNEGGEVAAPVVQAVMRVALHNLGVAPHCTAENSRPPAPGGPGTTSLVLNMTSMPDLIDLTPSEAATKARDADVVLSVSGSGARILRQNPPPGAMVQKYTAVQGYTEADALEPGTLVAAPALRGLTLEQAAQALSQAGLNLDATGVGVVEKQSPAPGERVPVGSSVQVTLRGGA